MLITHAERRSTLQFLGNSWQIGNALGCWFQNGFVASAGQKECTCVHAGPLQSPLGKGVTSATKYVLAPYGYNTTIPEGYNYTARMASNTVQNPVLLLPYQVWQSRTEGTCLQAMSDFRPVNACMHAC